jgi:hypothetical protein
MLNRAIYYVGSSGARRNLTGGSITATVETAKKIASFCNLAVGWHYGDGGPVSQPTIAAAESILWTLVLEGISDTNAFPGINGEVMVTAYSDGHYIEAIVENDGSISLTHEFNDVEMFSKEHMLQADAMAKLRDILGEIWSTSASYTPNTSIITLRKTVSRVWLSETHPTAAEHLLFNVPVLTQPTLAFAATLDTIIPRGYRRTTHFLDL